jgi:hypothetical protein
MFRSLSAVALGATVWLLTVSAVRAEGKPPAKEPQASAAKESHLCGGEAAIETALGKPAQLHFVDRPLNDVVEYLKEHYGIEIQLDKKALDDVGIGSDTPITKNVNGISLRSALQLMLRDLKLTWMIQDEVLLITTPEEFESKMTTKVLDVADLVVCRDSEDKPWDDYDTLINMITSTIMPTTWDSVGGPGSIAPANLGSAKALVISQTDDVHCQIAEILAKIRAIAKETPDAGPPRRDKPKLTVRAGAPKEKELPPTSKPSGGKGFF